MTMSTLWAEWIDTVLIEPPDYSQLWFGGIDWTRFSWTWWTETYV